MFKIMVYKELRGVFFSPKFVGMFGISALLLIVSTLIGIFEYRSSVREYETGRRITETQLSDQTGWSTMQYRAYRRPEPLQILASGVAFDLGRWSYVDNNRSARLLNSTYSNDTVFAVFRFMDFSFIVLVVFSLLALVFTYDAICGESESGTLRLVFANPIARAPYLWSKVVGAWLGLVIPLAVPVLICLLLIQLFGVDFQAGDWYRLLLFLVVALLFLTFFVVLGVTISALTKRSSTSFLISLMCWILLVFILPRMGMLVANRVVAVPSVAEIDGKQSAFAREEREKYFAGLLNVFRKFVDENPDASQEQSFAFQDSVHKALMSRISQNEAALLTEKRHAATSQRRLADLLCQLSPASSYQLASYQLANTDVELKDLYEDAIDRYRLDYASYFGQKKIDGPGTNRIISYSDGAGNYRYSFPRIQRIDLSDFPRFMPPTWSSSTLPQILIEIGLLICFSFAAFVTGWVAFMRYDLR